MYLYGNVPAKRKIATARHYIFMVNAYPRTFHTPAEKPENHFRFGRIQAKRTGHSLSIIPDFCRSRSIYSISNADSVLVAIDINQLPNCHCHRRLHKHLLENQRALHRHRRAVGWFDGNFLYL